MSVQTHKLRFLRLTQPWWQRLYGAARRQADNAQAAEDWLQETLLRAWRDFAQLGEDIAVYPWLLTILGHVIADDRRRDARRHQLAPVLAVDDAVLRDYPCSAPGPFQQAIEQQTHAQISAAVRDLPEDFRRVVMLRDMEELSYREIAGVLNVPEGTVMSRLSRGRRMLAATLIRLLDADQPRTKDQPGTGEKT